MGDRVFSFQQHSALAAVVLLFSILYVPVVSEIARIVLYGYLLGAWTKHFVFTGKDISVVSSIAYSIALSASLFLLIGWIVPVSSVLAHSILAAIAAVAFILYKRKKSVVDELQMPKHYALIIVAFVILPLLPVFILNPETGFISDGWWHYSVFQSVKENTLPAPNLWLDGADAAYPYAHHVVMASIFGESPLDPHILFLIASALISIVLVFIAYAIARLFYAPLQSLWTAFTFYIISTIGSLFFLWDALRYLFTSRLIPEFVEFLRAHSGPHMYYGSMKFLSPQFGDLVGINIIFTGSVLVGSLQIVFMLACAYFFLQKEYVPAFLAYAGLLCSNPVIAIMYAGAMGFVALWQLFQERTWKPLIAVVVGGLAAAAIGSSYLYALVQKLSNLAGGSSVKAISLFPVELWTMLLLFAIGYLPLLILAILQIKENAKIMNNKKSREVLAYSTACAVLFTASVLLIAIVLRLGYLYASFALFVPLAFLAGPQFAKIGKIRPIGSALLVVIVLVGVGSSLLSTATYAYYKYPLDQRQIDASHFLSDTTDASAVILMDTGTLWDTKYIFTSNTGNHTVYPAVFGGKQVYLADTYTLFNYGENYAVQEEAYNAFWSAPSCERLPNQITHVYTPHGVDLSGLSCLTLIYEQNEIHIYKVRSQP